MKDMKLLLYCTKAKPYLYGMYSGFESRYGYHLTNDNNVCESHHRVLNGKIVAECDYEVDKLTNYGTSFRIMKYDDLQENYRYTNKVARGSCLDYTDLRRYFGTKDGYAIHIKNLHIFDKPKELNEVCKYDFWASEMFGINATSKDLYVPITKAPQNMMRVWLYENGEWVMYILISIQPQWMCKILNKEKTVEVRRVVLKEMLKCLN